MAVVSCNLNAAPSSSYDFSSVSGCQNWWMRFSALLSVAAKPDLPRSLAPFVTFTPLRSLSADAHNHALGLVNWCAKMKVTHRFGTAADAATGRTELKLQVKDEFGGRAFLLMQDGWAAQGAWHGLDDERWRKARPRKEGGGAQRGAAAGGAGRGRAAARRLPLPDGRERARRSWTGPEL